MINEQLPEITTLCKLLRYDSSTGKIFWKKRPVEMFSDGGIGAAGNCKTWAARFAGKEAFTAVDGGGYKHGHIFARKYLAHRVIWAISYGDWPKDQIDHINHDRADNRLVNLREASQRENMQNTSMLCTNTRGVTGVHWCNQRSKWVAKIIVAGKSKHLGRFSVKAEAIAARKAANIKYCFHRNHGT
jgi:hypothetical protein